MNRSAECFASYAEAVISLRKSICDTHRATFIPLVEELQGKDVTVIATGPTLNIFRPEGQTINVGVNHAIFRREIRLDYLFVQDNVPAILSAHAEQASTCKLFCANHVTYPQFNVADENLSEANVYRFYTHSVQSQFPATFTADILSNSIFDYTSIIFNTLQILLFCKPKRIFLVGCDCSDTQNFINEEQGGRHSTLIAPWKALKLFADNHFPETEIVSVNPIGLKGLFRDYYQNEPATLAFEKLASNELHAALVHVQHSFAEAPADRKVRLLLADLLRKSERYYEADLTIQEALQQDPQWGEGYQQLSFIAESSGKPEEALKHAQMAVEIEPTSMELRAHLTKLHYVNGNLEQIWDVINEAPSDAFQDYWCMKLQDMAGCNVEKHNHNAAIAAWTDALQLYPRDFRARYWEAEYLRKEGRLKEVTKLVQEALSFEPEWAEGFHQLANIYEEQGRLDDAVLQCHKAIKTAPLAVMYRGMLARILRKQGRLEESIAAIDEVLNVTPDWPDGHYEIAETRKIQSRMVDAITHNSYAMVLFSTESNFSKLCMNQLFELFNASCLGQFEQLAMKDILKRSDCCELYKQFSSLCEK